ADAAPMAILALVDAYRLKRWFELSDAPFHHDELINVAIGLTDALLALHNIAVAAESLGLGTCYQGSVLTANTRELLGTPAYVTPAGLLLLGYPAEDPETTPRLPLDAVTHRNTYRVPCDDEIEDWYGERYPDWEHSHDEEERARLEAEGITNWAQRIALGHFSHELLQVESLGLLENLRRAGFNVPTE
ncbi:MAG: hypothetical protein GF320_23130, partial [Armatimonadia bacterium]|nr:hypothetical protein [Armatimonadia bacterium]